MSKNIYYKRLIITGFHNCSMEIFNYIQFKQSTDYTFEILTILFVKMSKRNTDVQYEL